MKKKRCIILLSLVFLILLFSFPAIAYKFQVIKSTIPQVNVWLDEKSRLENVYVINEDFPIERIDVNLFSGESYLQRASFSHRDLGQEN